MKITNLTIRANKNNGNCTVLFDPIFCFFGDWCQDNTSRLCVTLASPWKPNLADPAMPALRLLTTASSSWFLFRQTGRECPVVLNSKSLDFHGQCHLASSLPLDTSSSQIFWRNWRVELGRTSILKFDRDSRVFESESIFTQVLGISKLTHSL